MAETAARSRWAWRCTSPSCGARERQPYRTEDEARRPADEHSRETGHQVAWGLLQGNGLH